MHHIDVASVHSAVEAQRDDIITFLRELCAIPSMDSMIGPVGEHAQAEMKKLGFDSWWFDSMGNTVGKHRQRPAHPYLRQPHRHRRHRRPRRVEVGPLHRQDRRRPLLRPRRLRRKGQHPRHDLRPGPGPQDGAAGRLDGLLLWQHGGVVRRHRLPCPGRARRAAPRLRRDRRADQDAGLPRPQGARGDGSGEQGAQRPRRQQPRGRQRHLQGAAGDRGHCQPGAGTGRPPLPRPRQDHRHRHEDRDAQHQRRAQHGHGLYRPPRHLRRDGRGRASSRCAT